MSAAKKLPLEIRRNYTIIDRGQAWELKCIVCNERFQLKKPAKGQDIHGGNILALLDHAASHPLLSEDEDVPPVSDVHPSSTTATVPPSVPFVHNAPTIKYENAYMVELVNSNMVKVSNFRDPLFEDYRKVQQVNDTHYRVVLRAANGKHAQLIGERLIRKHLQERT